MKTYLYNRISSGRQGKGDGLSRQAESPEVLDFIKYHKLEVVKTMIYTGSSFTGKNFNNDTILGEFIGDIKSGKIQTPVCLCFENWDRWGRDIEWKNTKRFLDLIYAGVSIGVVSMDIVIDQKVLAENASILQLVVNDIQRARKESQRKSSFGKRNISVKVEKAKQGEKIYFGGQSPRWISGVKDGEFILEKNMVAMIKRIYTLYLQGNSCVGIAKILNQEHALRFGLSKKKESTSKSKAHWYNTTIHNVLTNRSLIGWCKINDFESDNYYPEIIKESAFYKVQARIQHNATNRGGSPTGNVPNLFRRLCFCAVCGGEISVRYYRFKGILYSYMGCRVSKLKLCKDLTNWRTFLFERQVMLEVLKRVHSDTLQGQVNADSPLAKLNLELAKITEQITTTLSLMRDLSLPQLKGKLRALQTEQEAVQKQIQIEQNNETIINNSPSVLARLKQVFMNVGRLIEKEDLEGEYKPTEFKPIKGDINPALTKFQWLAKENLAKNRVKYTIPANLTDGEYERSISNLRKVEKAIDEVLQDTKTRQELRNLMPEIFSSIEILLKHPEKRGVGRWIATFVTGGQVSHYFPIGKKLPMPARNANGLPYLQVAV